MDPLTQGVVGTTAAQLLSNPKQKIAASVLGFLSGMAADMDVLIQSAHDPLFSLEYHRHFTHALVFIPIGALLCAVVFSFFMRRWRIWKGVHNDQMVGHLRFKTIYLFCFAGYATHALLDGCTTYGTQLLWPFSDARIAWNNVSVIDPLFTLPVLLLAFFAMIKQSSRMSWAAAVYAIAYLSLGLLQNHRAEQLGIELAKSRGHQPINLGVKPSFANILVWKNVYEYNGRYYVDAIRVGFSSKTYIGSSTEKLNVATHFSWLNSSSQQALDIERFRWFSNDHLGIDPTNSNRIIDIRYSLVPNRLDGMWGITLDPNATQEQYIEWNTNRPEGEALKQQTSQLWAMILGR